MSGTTINLFLILKLHSDLRRGIIHDQEVGDLADWLGVDEVTVYRCIAKLQEVGLFTPSRRNKIGGRLPTQQLLRLKKAQRRHEQRERKFYQELRERIRTWEKDNGQLADRTQVTWQFTDLVAVKKDNKHYYPKDDRAKRNIFDNLEKYAPLDESDLFKDIEAISS